MEINTIGDLKRELQKLQDYCGFSDDTPIRVPVQAYTQAHAADAFKITMLQGGYGGACLWVNLPEGFIISERKSRK